MENFASEKETPRLRLIPANLDMLRVVLQDTDELGRLLHAKIASGWPPQFFDQDAVDFMIPLLESEVEGKDWWSFYFILVKEENVVVGTAGFKGPPDENGCIEFGYGIVPDYYRQGIATEASHGLLTAAFARPDVKVAIAETYPDLVASIGVMRKLGMRFIGQGSEEGVIRYELKKENYHQP